MPYRHTIVKKLQTFCKERATEKQVRKISHVSKAQYIVNTEQHYVNNPISNYDLKSTQTLCVEFG